MIENNKNNIYNIIISIKVTTVIAATGSITFLPLQRGLMGVKHMNMDSPFSTVD